MTPRLMLLLASLSCAMPQSALLPESAVETSDSPSGARASSLCGDGVLSAGEACLPGAFYVTGLRPEAIGLGDFNEDQKLDLVTANQGEETISILLGREDGTFLPAVDLVAKGVSSALAVGDIDQDGHLDLATSLSSGGVSLFFGVGDGSFPRLSFVNTGGQPGTLELRDLNHDQALDLIALYPFSNIGEVLLGVGGAFGRPASLDAGRNPTALALGDMNGDQKLDLVIAGFDSRELRVLLGAGDGTFLVKQVVSLAGVQAIEGRIRSVTIADVNQDKLLDIAAVDQGDLARVLSGRGDGSFLPPVSYEVDSNPSKILVADVSLDSLPDLVVVNQISGTVSILKGQPDGTMAQAVSYEAGSFPHDAVVGDFNKDWLIDIAMLQRESGGVSVFLGAPGGGLATASKVETPGGPSPDLLRIADLNRDAVYDLILGDRFDDTVRVLFGSKHGYAPPVSFPAGKYPDDLAIGDLDGDLWPDLVVANADADCVSILINREGKSFQNPRCLPTGDYASAVALGEINGDGWLDIVATNFGSNTVSLLLSKGKGTFAAHTEIELGNKTDDISLIDLNQDKLLDIVVADLSDKVSVRLGLGGGRFGPPQSSLGLSHIERIVSGDFNEDRIPDLAVAGIGRGEVGILLGKGDGGFGAPLEIQTQFGSDTGWRSPLLAVADLDLDGHVDVVASLGGQLVLLFGRGDGSFRAPRSFVGGANNSLGVVDLNGDSLLDIVTGDSAAERLYFFFGAK